MTSTTYYLQGNGQAKFTNKVIISLFIKLVNENHIDWDEHLHTILYAYHTTFKVTIEHTSFQFVMDFTF
jgi:plasmid rolling circle replication initiator protein Rep